MARRIKRDTFKKRHVPVFCSISWSCSPTMRPNLQGNTRRDRDYLRMRLITWAFLALTWHRLAVLKVGGGIKSWQVAFAGGDGSRTRLTCMIFSIPCHWNLCGQTRGAGVCPLRQPASLIDVRRSSGISGRSALAFVLSISCQTVRMFEGAWTSGPFHGDEWLFSSVLLPSYEKGDLVIGRLYEAIKNVCQSAVSNAIP